MCVAYKGQHSILDLSGRDSSHIWDTPSSHVFQFCQTI